MSTSRSKNIIILLHNGTTPSDPTEAAALQQAWTEIQNNPLYKRSIRIICVNNTQVSNYIQHNQSGLVITHYPVFITKKSPNGPRIWSITSYNNIFQMIQEDNSDYVPPTNVAPVVTAVVITPTIATDIAAAENLNPVPNPLITRTDLNILDAITDNNCSSQSSGTESESESEISESETTNTASNSNGKHNKHHGKHHKKYRYQSNDNSMNVNESLGKLKFGTQYKGDKGEELTRLSNDLKGNLF